VKGEAAKTGADCGKDAGPGQLVKNLFGSPARAQALAGDSTNLRSGELGKLCRKRAGDGSSFPPGLEARGEVGGEPVAVKRRIRVAAGNIENAACIALLILPGNKDPLRRKERRSAIAKTNGSDLVLTEREPGFFTAIAQPIGAEEKAANVPGGVTIVDARHGGRREVDENAAPGVGFNALPGEFFV